MQVLQTLRLMMVMMMGRSHCGAHRVVPMLMVRWAPSMRMVLGGMMLMRMIGGRQEARRRRINTRTVTGRPAERCCEQSMRNCVLYYLIWRTLLPHFPPLILFQMNFSLYKYNINILYHSIRKCRKVLFYHIFTSISSDLICFWFNNWVTFLHIDSCVCFLGFLESV